MKMHCKLRNWCLGWIAGVGLSVLCAAMPPTAAERAQCTAWVNRNFGPIQPATQSVRQTDPPRAGLVVIENHGPVLINGRPDGRPLKIGKTEFKKGLLCHGPSQVVVRLPGPGKSFVASVGVDANAGGGSVVFAVVVAGKETFKSGVMRGSEPGLPVSVDLGGAHEFTVTAGNAGDGITCDHADWADARVTLQDGKELWISDLPLAGPPPPRRLSSIPPFSFLYDGKSSDELLPAWTFKESTENPDNYRTRHTQVYTDPKTGLQVRAVVVSYGDYPTVEWTLFLKNTGAADTPILESIQALDIRIERSNNQGEFKLHHFTGSIPREDDFQPLETVLGPNAEKRITGAAGRPTGSDLCYFNLETSDRQGIIIGLGWPGQWAASFTRDSDRILRVVCGQELTHLKLHPGEEVRTPLVALQFWQGGDWTRAQNTWRRWMAAHNMPLPGGRPVPPQFGGCAGNYLPRAEEEIAQIEAYLKEGTKLDHWIIDTGWFPCNSNWVNTGTWEVDATRFPKGLREVADHLHERGIEFIVWFEPERAAAGTWLARNHPDWILGGKNGGLVNLGSPEARTWVTERMDGLIVSEGIDVYRSDYNIDPLSYWRNHDAPDRQGITENFYVQGFLAFWDELLRRHPRMYIDTCASGGKRIDLETLRRSVPLLRSDWAVWKFTQEGAIGQQCQTYGMSYWIPYHGTGAPCSDLYTLRSSFCPAYRVGYNPLDPDRNAKLFQQALSEYRRTQPYLLGDFYPLTPYRREKSAWIAWQYDAPEKGGGVVQAFRREGSPDTSMQCKLQGLNPKSEYLVTNLDEDAPQRITGQALRQEGLALRIDARPGSAIWVYKKID